MNSLAVLCKLTLYLAYRIGHYLHLKKFKCIKRAIFSVYFPVAFSHAHALHFNLLGRDLAYRFSIHELTTVS